MISEYLKMEFVLILIPFLSAIYTSRKYKIPLVKIFILSILPIVIIETFFILFQIVHILLFTREFDNTLEYFNIFDTIQHFVMSYFLAFFSLVFSSILVLYFKNRFSMSLFRLLLLTPPITLFCMTIHIILWGNMASFMQDLTLYDIIIPMSLSIILGLLSVSILYYFTDYKKI